MTIRAVWRFKTLAEDHQAVEGCEEGPFHHSKFKFYDVSSKHARHHFMFRNPVPILAATISVPYLSHISAATLIVTF